MRRKAYRGQEGWAVRGKDALGRECSIFTLTRSSADHIRDKVKAGGEVTLEDFDR